MSSTGIAGRVSGHPGGDGRVRVQLQADPYPYGKFAAQASVVTAPDGTYAFKVFPARNTRYRVALREAPGVRSAPVAVTVDELTESRIHYESPGRAEVIFRSGHPADLDWGHRRVRWYLSRGSTDHLRRVKATRTHSERQ